MSESERERERERERVEEGVKNVNNKRKNIHKTDSFFRISIESSCR